MTPEDIIREYNDAELTYRLALAQELSRDEWVALPQDVREARAVLEIETEALRLRDAKSAYETIKADREERWIAAHEDLAVIRQVKVN